MHQNRHRQNHQSQANPTRPKVSYQDEQIEMVLPSFKNGDFVLTLTNRETSKQFSADYKPDLLGFNKTIKHFLGLVHDKFLGKNKSKKNRLYVAFTFELNANKGLHTHMILQALPTNRVPKHEHVEVLRKLWASMKFTGNKSGTRVEEAYNVRGWVKYMFKKSHIHNSEYYDPIYWHLNK